MSKEDGLPPLRDDAPLLNVASLLDGGPIKERLERNPYGVVAAAIGLGFVLGGGLFTRLTGRLAFAGLRVGLTAALPFLQEELLASVMGAAAEPESSAPVKSDAGANSNTEAGSKSKGDPSQ